MKKKTSKGILVKSVYELPHIFAHKKGDIKFGNYEIKDNKFYKWNNLIAIKISNNLFVSNNITSGIYRNGLSSSHILNAFSNSIHKYRIINVNEELQVNIENYIKELVINNLSTFSRLYDVIHNSRVMVNWDYLQYINDLSNKYKKIRRRFYNKIDFTFVNEIIGKHWYNCYNGWTRTDCIIDINKTYKQVLTGHFYNKKEKEIYNAKRFWYIYIHTNPQMLYSKGIKLSYPKIKDKLDLYNNTELKNRILQIFENYRLEVEKRKKEEYEELILTYNKDLVEWMTYNLHNIYIPYLPYGPNYTLITGLRFNKDKSEIVTSMGARVPTSHAKRLFQIFNKLEVDNKEFIANGKSINIGVYKVKSIKKMKINGVEEYTLIAGCHTITASIIHKFIEINNLDW